MKKKNQFIKYGTITAFLLIIYFTGLHAQVVGWAQKNIFPAGETYSAAETPGDSGMENRSANHENTVLDFNLVNSSGETVNLEKFRGKVIFMNLWATWCPPCVAEMPTIQKLYEDMKNENVEFIMLSLDRNFEIAKKYREEKGYDFEIYRVAAGLPAQFQTSSIPTTFVINPQGEIDMTHKGMADYSTNDFKTYLRDLK